MNILDIANKGLELASKVYIFPFKAVRTHGPTGGGNTYWWIETWHDLYLNTDSKGKQAGQKIATLDHGVAGQNEAELFAHASNNHAALCQTVIEQAAEIERLKSYILNSQPGSWINNTTVYGSQKEIKPEVN